MPNFILESEKARSLLETEIADLLAKNKYEQAWRTFSILADVREAISAASQPPAQSQTALNYIEITQNNNFTAPSILHNASPWFKAKADTFANSDFWLCIEANATSFRLANRPGLYYFPNHQIGADDQVKIGSRNDIIYLSAVTSGLITTTEPTTAGQYRVLLGSILNDDYIWWSPSLRAEEV